MIAKHKAHRHIPVFSEDAHHQIHGGGLAGRFNAWLAVAITRRVGSMWCAYLFAILALVSLPSVLASGSTQLIIAWVAQTFLQLVLLPIIIVGQNVQAAASDQRALADHQTLEAVHALTVAVHDINEAQSAILKRLDDRPVVKT